MAEASEAAAAANTAQPTMPKDGQLLALIIKSMDVSECEPQVIPLLLEFMYRHVTETLQDALQFADHCGRKDVPSLNDVRYAVQSKASHSFVPPPSRELMMELATKKNAVPLPLVKSSEKCIRLPPDDHCLFSPASSVTGVSILAAPKTAGAPNVVPGQRHPAPPIQ